MARLITPHFSWDEVIHSPTAVAKGIDNTIPLDLVENVQKTAEQMELVRRELGGPVKVNSWYRCPALNAAVGGSKTSQHMLGSAVDFKPTTVQIKVAFEMIARSTIPFDQLIHERTKSGANWVHIGFSFLRTPRRQVLRASGDTLGGPMVFTRVNEG
jgi:zinc D-Ala-D-Ala carboxypeptidase